MSEPPRARRPSALLQVFRHTDGVWSLSYGMHSLALLFERERRRGGEGEKERRGEGEQREKRRGREEVSEPSRARRLSALLFMRR